MGGGLGIFFLILILAGRCSDASFCLCKKGSDDALQPVLDYACENGADCGPIQPNGTCFNPDTVRDHCSYAVNSYYTSKAAQGATCDFRGAAYLSNTDPSSNGCTYTAAAGSAPTTPGSSSSTPGSSSSSTSPPGTGSPYTPGVIGSGGYGLAPTGQYATDVNRAHVYTTSVLAILFAAGSFVFLWS